MAGSARERTSIGYAPWPVNAVGSLLRVLPRSSATGAVEPPLLSDAEFARQLDEVIGRRDGVGWTLGGDLPTALAARLSDGEDARHASPLVEALTLHAGEHSDAFSGRVAGPPGRTPGERLMATAAWARAASELLVERGARPHVGILDGARIWVAESPGGRPLTDIAMDIGWALSVRQFESIGPDGVQQADVPAVVALDRRSIQEARHVHRTGGLRGPWLGVCIGNRSHHAPPLELVAGAREVIAADDLASLMRRLHLRADGLLAELEEGSTQAIARDLTRKFGDLWRPRRSWRMPPRTEGREEYVARSIDPSTGDAPLPAEQARMAWALGVALHRFLGDRGWSGDLSPAVRVLHRVDDTEAGRRAVLTAVRFSGSTPEPLAAFTARFAEQCAREADGFGLLSEWLRRVTRQPLTSAGRARFVKAMSALSHLGGPVAALGGVATLAFSELPPRREAPWRVYSGSTPPTAPWGSGFSGGVALHVHRLGDVVDLVATARGTFAERESAPRFVDLVIDAARSA